MSFSLTNKFQIGARVISKIFQNPVRQPLPINFWPFWHCCNLSGETTMPSKSFNSCTIDPPDHESIKVIKLSSYEYNKTPKLPLVYGTTPTKFGNCLAAFRDNALCYLTFYESDPPFENLKKVWTDAPLHEDNAFIAESIAKLFGGGDGYTICIKGTDFELEVWEALLKVKKGTTASYEDMAVAIGRPKAVRAAARAIAKNNVAYFIPCHRIIKKDGSIHKYGGGVDRKVKMLKDEGAI